MDDDTCQWLRKISLSDVQGLTERLKGGDIVHDEDDTFFTKSCCEGCFDEFVKLLKANGYSGTILTTGGYFPRLGSLWAAFDSDVIEYEEARRQLKEYANSKE